MDQPIKTVAGKRLHWLSVLVLLIAALAIISHADQLATWFDEAWTIFHSSASVRQILAERDVTWPPGYFLTLHAWAGVASWNDFVLHSLGAFCGLLSIAFLIRIGRRIANPAAGLLAGLAFATSSYAIYFTLEIRGYSLMLLAETAFIEIYLRWLKRPTILRSMALLAVQIAMLYTHFILGVVIALAFVHLLLNAPRRFWRWLVVAALTGIALLPIADQFVRAISLKASLGGSSLPAYYTYDFSSYYQAFSAHADLWFALILILAAIGLIFAIRRIGWRPLVWLALWGLAIPVGAYITRETSAIFTTRYLSFTLPAAFLLMGIGLANLPALRLGSQRITSLGPMIGAAVLLVLALAPWQPFDHRPKESDDGAPLHVFMRQFAQHWQAGDALVIDPNCQYDELAWAYYQQLYFPQGHILTVADGSQAGRRVWYLVRQGKTDSQLASSVQEDRLNAGEFVGPWYFIATLYEGPPLSKGLLFGDVLRFHGADISRRQGLHAGDMVNMTLWWSVDKPLPPELSMSIQLLGPAGNVVAQLDGMPKTPGTPDQLDAWQPEKLYLDRRELQVPYQLPDGNYKLQLVVYRYQDGTRLTPERDATPAKTLIIDKVRLYSFAAW